jgi:hypothetical protein
MEVVEILNLEATREMGYAELVKPFHGQRS